MAREIESQTRIGITQMTPDQMKKAEKMAREIESQTSNNVHLQEERGHAIEREGDLDEEDLYSGVLGAYTAPKGPSGKGKAPSPGAGGNGKQVQEKPQPENVWHRGEKWGVCNLSLYSIVYIMFPMYVVYIYRRVVCEYYSH